MAQTNSTDVVIHNQGHVDAFGYQAALVKKSGSDEKKYSITAFASEINVFESLFAKAMCCTVSMFDGAGLMETIALQPGDEIEIVLFTDENSKKLIKRFVILNIDNINRVDNSQAKTYRLSGISAHAFLNKRATVYRAFKGTHSDMVKQLCADYLALPEIEIEPSVGDTQVVSGGRTPFKMLAQLMMHAISAEGGETNSLYFFFEHRDGVSFKTLRKIVADATEPHKLCVSVDKNVDGAPDLSKIQAFAQLKAGSQAERISAGMYENEIVEYDHISRKINSTQWKYKDSGKGLQLLAGQRAAEDENVDPWVTTEETKLRGKFNVVKLRAADEAFDQLNNYGKKFGSMVAQKAMFNQIIYAIQIFGNTDIKAGDLVDIEAPALAMAGSSPELDFSLTGRFLVGDVRHRVMNGEQFLTVLNIFREGYDVAYKPEAAK